MFISITDSSDDDINTNDINYCVSSSSTNPNVNIVNVKTDHEEEDEVKDEALQKKKTSGILQVQF